MTKEKDTVWSVYCQVDKSDWLVFYKPMNNYTRKKQPQQVRERILEAAGAIALEKGLAGLTLEGVAQAAGVSKGGLIHHFSNKATLQEALMEHDLHAFESAWLQELEREAPGPARATSAYVRTVALSEREEYPHLGMLSLAMSLDKSLAWRWRQWLDSKLRELGEDPTDLQLRVARYAADGIWLEVCSGSFCSKEERCRVAQYLLEKIQAGQG